MSATYSGGVKSRVGFDPAILSLISRGVGIGELSMGRDGVGGTAEGLAPATGKESGALESEEGRSYCDSGLIVKFLRIPPRTLL